MFEVFPQALVQGEPGVARKAKMPGAKAASPKTALKVTIMMYYSSWLNVTPTAEYGVASSNVEEQNVTDSARR